MRLHQFLALQKQANSRGEGDLTRAHHAVAKKELLAGIEKKYEPLDENGQKLPGESTKLQTRVPVVLASVVPALVRQYDVQATVDAGNQVSKADVMVDGHTILEQVPVETLLFLEKKLDILYTFVNGLPVLDDAEDWDDNDGQSFKTKPSAKVRTDKVPERFVKAEATDKHPAQVEILYLDKVVGTWLTTKFSGALKPEQKRDLVERVSKLLAAVKTARGEANSTVVEDKKIGQAVFDYLGWTQ